MGLSAWKVLLVLAVVAFLFLPRFIRMGRMLKGLVQRFAGDDRAEPPIGAYGPGPGGQTVIDGETGMVIRPKAPPPRPLPERIGLALGRMVRRVF